ncbi:MAG: extracellular solute-binding protein [Chloroflexota bacterium]
MGNSKLSRRHFLQLTGGMLGVAALAACTPPAAAPGNGDGGGAPQETDSLWFVIAKDFHPGYDAFLRESVQAWTAEQGLELEMVDSAGFASGSGELEKLAASVQSGDAPDLVHGTYAATQVQNLGLVVPASDIVSEIEEVYGPAAPFLQQTLVLDGEWQVIPHHQRSVGGYYRRDAFDEAGIDLQEIRTLDDTREACLAVSKPDEEFYGWGLTPNRSGDGNGIINRVKCGYGAGWQDETGQFITCNSDEMITAMNWLKDTYTDPAYEAMLPPGILAWNDISNNEAYLGGVIGYTHNAGTVYAKAVIDENPVAPLTNYHKPPGGPVNQEFVSMPAKMWYMMTGAKNASAARDMVLHFTANLEVMDSILASSPAYAIPGYTNLWEMSEFTQGFEPALQQKTAALDESGIDAGPWPGPPSAAMDAIGESGAFNDMVNSILTGTEVTEAISIAHDRMVLIFKEFDLPGEA